MLDRLAGHPWHLILGLSVVLAWCVVGWCGLRRGSRRAEATQGSPSGGKTSISWAEDVRRAAEEDLDGFCERWRDRLPPR